jgi:sigma-B regulation protein RsbU (phosphoserine phosphatase)
MLILVADDDSTSRNMLSAMLTKCGHEVVAYCDGAEAWEAMQRPDAPQMLVLDWMMPVMDGVEVCRRIRAAGSPGRTRPHILMLTARAEKARIVEGLDAGADDYLTKPYDADELRARIRVGCRMLDIQSRLDARVEELSRALCEIKRLEGILPICAYCKKIRDDRNRWQRVEEYMQARSEARFSHSVCPECAEKVLAGIEAEPSI